MALDLGTYGIWRGAVGWTPELAQEVEALGFGAIWIGGSPPGDLALAESLVAATDHLVVATGIVNMWGVEAGEAAASTLRIAEKYPDRFLLGLGIGHPEADKTYASPYQTMVDYLDVLDGAGVSKDVRALAALGPKVLKLSAERTAGAHPYLTTPEHTREAREVLGPDALLAPEQKVVLLDDAERARAIGRGTAKYYLRLRNYVANFKRMGFTDDDLAGEGSDAFIDAMVIHGGADVAAAGLTAHIDAGASHVCAQVLTEDDADPLPAMRELARALHLG